MADAKNRIDNQFPPDQAPELSKDLTDDLANVPNRAVDETGVSAHGVSDRSTGSGQPRDHMASGSKTTGGDIYSYPEQAKVVGEEAVGGTTPTPDQNVVEDIAQSVGVEIPDRKPVQGEEMMNRRDDSRWELDPKSSEDYERRRS